MKRDDRGDPVEGCIRERDLLRAALLKSNRGSVLLALGDFPPVRLQDDHFRAPRGEPFVAAPAPPPRSRRRTPDVGAMRARNSARSAARFLTLALSIHRSRKAMSDSPA